MYYPPTSPPHLAHPHGSRPGVLLGNGRWPYPGVVSGERQTGLPLSGAVSSTSCCRTLPARHWPVLSQRLPVAGVDASVPPVCSAFQSPKQTIGLCASAAVSQPTVPVLCLIIVPADDDSHFTDQRAAGHPDNLRALRAAGASVRIVRASCMCQGRRLANESETVDLVHERDVVFRSPQGGDPASLACGLTHLRCWTEAAESALGSSVLILEASASLLPGTEWTQVLRVVSASVARGDDLVLLSAPSNSSTMAYAFSPAGLAELAGSRAAMLSQVVTDSETLLTTLLHDLRSVKDQSTTTAPGHWRPLRATQAAVLEVCPQRSQSRLPPAPRLVPQSPHNRVKVIIITLPHRSDRRVEPLVGSSAAISAMREAGFDVELMRASCYCERDRMNERGSFAGFVGDGFQWASMRRYPGAELPMAPREAARLRAAIDRYYLSGADRLIAADEGDVKGYVVDTNWPGATACAMSQMRAMVGAAIGGYEYALVFEDDAVITSEVAREKGWCDSCEHELCNCASSWAACVTEAVELARRAPSMDALYIGMGEEFERRGPAEGILEAGTDTDSDDEHAGITEIGYTWQAHAILYARSALADVLALRLHELLWAQDETIPHLYSRRPWNSRFVRALRDAGWRRRWTVGTPADAPDAGWVHQLESVDVQGDGDLGLGTAAASSNSQEF